MNILIETAALKRAVDIAGKAVASRTTKPILAGVHLDATGDDLLVTGTDLDTTVRVRVGAKVEAGGSVVVVAAKFKEVLATIESPLVRVQAAGGGEAVRVREVKDKGAAKFDLPCWEPDAFPTPAEPDADEPHWTADITQFKAALGLVRHAVAVKSNIANFSLDGIRMEFAASAVNLLGMDTKQLAMATCPLQEVNEPADIKQTVPLKLLPVLDAIADKGELKIGMSKSQATFTIDGVTVVSRLLEGRFPPYAQLLGLPTNHVVVAGVEELCRRVRQARLATDDESSRVDFAFTPNKAVLTARSPNSGSSEVECEVGYDGDGLAVALDPDFVKAYLEALAKAKVEQVRVECSDPAKPVIFRPVGGNGCNLISPMY